jgi:hypothetical protein
LSLPYTQLIIRQVSEPHDTSLEPEQPTTQAEDEDGNVTVTTVKQIMTTIAREYPNFAYKMGLTSANEPSKVGVGNSGKDKFGRKKTQQKVALEKEIRSEDKEIRRDFLVS